MSDEAHRSQYGIFADHMMKLLPTAARIGFTGTPLLSSDNITARTFGGYVSVYDFKRAVEDGATVPLYYENRGEKIADLHNPKITEQILDAIENADLDVDQQDKLEAEFAKEIHLLTAESRLKSIVRDFVNHYSDLWTSGKAMFVCLNKVTCVRMYNYVQEYWKEEIKKLKAKIKKATQQEAQELERRLKWMQETEMAVVISQEQNEIQTFRKWDLDIKYHRAKMEKRELDKEFKDSKNPLRVVLVCAMRMLFANPERINYYERYQQIIDDYNSEQDRATIEKTFMDLMDLANSMNQEEQRYVREGFASDEELSLYDMLFREDLSKNDIKKLKEVAASLLQKIKSKISELDHWTDKQETKAAVDNLIRDTLWAQLPECYDEVSISVYRQQIYEYVYTRYKEAA